mmetsp:Transcript_110878/g.300924  ORF Transcript_110878/g.300924 Transcript_110878/m.300924 type:complete len:534 (+) Transcript_110878:105-1706(+)
MKQSRCRQSAPSVRLCLPTLSLTKEVGANLHGAADAAEGRGARPLGRQVHRPPERKDVAGLLVRGLGLGQVEVVRGPLVVARHLGDVGLARLDELLVDLRGHVPPALPPSFLELHLPEAAGGTCRRQALQGAGRLAGLVLPPVDHHVLRVNLRLVEEDELPVRPRLCLSVAADAIESLIPCFLTPVTGGVHDERLPDIAAAHQQGVEPGVRVPAVVPPVLVGLRSALRHVDPSAIHRAGGRPCVVQHEAGLHNTHGRRRVGAVEQIGVASGEPPRDQGLAERRLRLEGVVHRRLLAPASVEEALVERGVLASEGRDEVHTVRHLLVLRGIVVGLPVACQHPLEGAVEHDLQGVSLLRGALHDLLRQRAVLDLLRRPIGRKVHLDDVIPVVVGVVVLRHRDVALVPVVPEHQLVQSQLPVLPHVALGGDDKTPAQPVDKEVANPHHPLRDVILRGASAKEHADIVLDAILVLCSFPPQDVQHERVQLLERLVDVLPIGIVRDAVDPDVLVGKHLRRLVVPVKLFLALPGIKLEE